MPKLSIIVPVYNVEKYIRRCIDSISNQSFEDFELLLIDDGSTDNSGKICDEYAKKDKRIVCIHQENSGVSAARNKGLDIAKGDYIGFVDSDDYIHKDMYKELIYHLEENNADVSICSIILTFENYAKPKENTGKVQVFCGKKTCYENLLLNNFGFFVYNKIFKRDLCGQVRFNIKMKIAEDAYFNYLTWKYIDKVVKIEKALYFYVQERDGRATGSGFSDCSMQLLDYYKLVYEDIKNEESIIDCWFAGYMQQSVLALLGLIFQTYKSEKNARKLNEYSLLIDEVIVNRSKITKNKYISKKNKLALLFVSISPSLYCFLYLTLRKVRDKYRIVKGRYK